MRAERLARMVVCFLGAIFLASFSQQQWPEIVSPQPDVSELNRREEPANREAQAAIAQLERQHDRLAAGTLVAMKR